MQTLRGVVQWISAAVQHLTWQPPDETTFLDIEQIERRRTRREVASADRAEIEQLLAWHVSSRLPDDPPRLPLSAARSPQLRRCRPENCTMNTPLTPSQQTMLATWRLFLASIPSDIELIPVSEIFEHDRLVEAVVVRFTHSRRMDWMLLGAPPTGLKAEFLLIVLMEFRNGKLACQHMHWDRATGPSQRRLPDTPAAEDGIGSAAWLRELVAHKSDGLQ